MQERLPINPAWNRVEKDMRARSRLRAVFAGVGCALTLASCSAADLPLIGPAPSDLASGAASALSSEKAMRVKGSFIFKAVSYTVDLSLAPRKGGPISGKGTYEQVPFQVVATSDKTYFQGAGFWNKMTTDGTDGGVVAIRQWPGFGSGWVVAAPGDTVATALAELYDLGGLLPSLGNDANHAKKATETMRNGTSVIPVIDGGATYYVTSQKPYHLRRIASRTTSRGITGLTLDIDSAKLDATAPASGQFVDPQDPSTLPAIYRVAGFGPLQNCDDTGCGLTATVTNTTGPPQGQAVVTLKLFKEDQTTLIGSCDTPVPALQHAQSADVSCRVSGDGYTAFYNSISPGSDAQVYKGATLKNPPYS